MKQKTLKYKVEDINEKGIVTVAISRFDNRDSYDDIVRKGAFTKTFKEGANRIKHVLDHDISYRSVVGLPISMVETDKYAVVESALNLDLPQAKDLFSNYKFFAEHGRSLEHSFAYQVISSKENDDIKGVDITELKMYEYSTVNLGANPDTHLLDLKSFKSQSDVIKSIEDLTNHLKSGDITDEYGKNIEQLITKLKSFVKPIDSLNQTDIVNIFKNL